MVNFTERFGGNSFPQASANTHSSGLVDVVFVQMPFADIVRPSLALGILKAALETGGLRCSVEYANLSFSDDLGGALPDFPYLRQFMGEWLFAAAAFPEHPQVPPDVLIQRGPQVAWLPGSGFRHPRMREILLEVQAYTPVFVERIARKIVAKKPRIVGCSSMFEQHCAALALLRAVKRLDPNIITMMGGANCEAEMGWTTIRAFDWVDCVVSGEADLLILPLCRDWIAARAAGQDLSIEQMPNGVFGRAHVRADAFANPEGGVPRASVFELDRCAVPDFDDYFEALKQSSFHDRLSPGLPVETSRGCWWGAKSHCTFCGLNGGSMAYRSKSPDRVLAEFDQLTTRYGIHRLMVVDNILDMQYFKNVVPELARKGAPYQIFYETKANLKREQVRQLAEAGVIWFQPGIEGLHDDLLRLMAKGNSTMINLQLLKYAREFGIYTTWLMLVGFPDEEESWHEQVAEWLPMVFHLQPPSCLEPVLYERFSVFHQRPESFGLTLKPEPFYSSIFPVSEKEIEELVFFFTNEKRPKDAPLSDEMRMLSRQVSQWSRLHKRPLRPLLCMDDDGDKIKIFDTRPCATARRHELEGLQAALYRVCDPAPTREALVGRFASVAGEDEIVVAIEDLKAKKLLLDFHGKLLALAVPGDCPAYCEPRQYPGGNGRRPPPFSLEVLERLHERLVRLNAGEGIRC